MKSLIIIVMTVLSAQAAVADDPYESGQQFCQENSSKVFEMAKWVKVPLSYSDASLGTTQLYTWMLKAMDPAKPTFIYFVGGPGGSTHGESFSGMDDWNIIYFDQRGVACSAFATAELANDPHLYSSELTARDADEIRKAYGLQSISAYGHSYGTVPATIFASFFPATTRALALEGVIYRGDSDIWRSPHRRKLLQNFYNSLSVEDQGYVQAMSQQEGGRYLFSQIDHSLSYQEDLDQHLRSWLKSYKENMGPAHPSPAGTLGEAFEYSPRTFAHIACRELSELDPNSSFLYELKNGQFVAPTNDDDFKSRTADCQLAGVAPGSSLIQMYEAVHYPVRIPVTYLQGTTDGATEPQEAIHHFKTVPQNFSQLLLKVNSGHEPNIGVLMGHTDSLPATIQAQAQIFSLALQGKLVPQELLKADTAVDGHRWAATHRPP